MNLSETRATIWRGSQATSHESSISLISPLTECSAWRATRETSRRGTWLTERERYYASHMSASEHARAFFILHMAAWPERGTSRGDTWRAERESYYASHATTDVRTVRAERRKGVLAFFRHLIASGY